MFLPSVVSLKEYVKPARHPAFTRFNVFLRDRFQCQYCGSRDDLTFDHVIPRSKGGRTTWENVVAACAPCNLRKANRLPREIRCSRCRRRTSRPCMTCTIMAGRSRPTICTRAGWTICTGISSSSRKAQAFAARAPGRPWRRAAARRSPPKSARCSRPAKCRGSGTARRRRGRRAPICAAERSPKLSSPPVPVQAVGPGQKPHSTPA